MPLQTNYPSNLPIPVEGAPATEVPSTIISRTVEDGAGLSFGKPVAQGMGARGIVAFAGVKFVGITIMDRSARATGYAQYDEAGVWTGGDIWVTASVAVAVGDQVHLTAAGAFTNVATNNTAITGARWDTSTTATGQLAVVRR
ncbi:hypothetical protein VDG07_12735 [Xanthomonas campestris pv. raphani]|uniref:structural cement protein Gp24 n=1 Tax=Xanthomonas campestris TaxID=339 RepID=UPI002B23E0C1|nr:hypothetical protein [Xanthomonas campestris]MEA9796198.1 hypothetical protein [Xanthomonas campestris pv. raphani]